MNTSDLMRKIQLVTTENGQKDVMGKELYLTGAQTPLMNVP